MPFALPDEPEPLRYRAPDGTIQQCGCRGPEYGDVTVAEMARRRDAWRDEAGRLAQKTETLQAQNTMLVAQLNQQRDRTMAEAAKLETARLESSGAERRAAESARKAADAGIEADRLRTKLEDMRQLAVKFARLWMDSQQQVRDAKSRIGLLEAQLDAQKIHDARVARGIPPTPVKDFGFPDPAGFLPRPAKEFMEKPFSTGCGPLSVPVDAPPDTCAPFAPMTPLLPVPIDTPVPDGVPRMWQYVVGGPTGGVVLTVNLTGSRIMSDDEVRQLAAKIGGLIA